MLALAYNIRPQKSTGVAPLEFVTPERVWSLSVERMVGVPTPEETDGSPRAIQEVIRTRLRNLIRKVRRSLTLAQWRYKKELRRPRAAGQRRCPSGGLGALPWPRADQVQALNQRGRTVRGVSPQRRHFLVRHRRMSGDGEQRPRDGGTGPAGGSADAPAELRGTPRRLGLQRASTHG